MKFDWYQTTIEDNPSVVIETLAKLGHEVRPNDGIAKAYRFRQGFEVHHNQRGIVATVLMGGNGKNPHAWASSDEAPAFADLVRTEWDGKHLVTRVDAAEDFVEPGGYDRLRKVCRKVAKGHRLKFRQQVDDLNPTAGRTQYIGSNKSDYLGRLYEKGFEVLGKIPVTAGCRLNPEFVLNESSGQFVKLADWTRLEIQARPKREEARRLASVASPEQIWTFTDWTQELARDALALDLERFFIRTRKVSKDEEALRWMCRQYARMLLRLKDDLGDWDCVGREIGEIIHQEHSSAAR
jgi:hypothetical protein